jgi:hypothetical protein
MPKSDRWPCAWLELTGPEDRGYAEGYRFTVVQFDGDTHFFLEKERSESFIEMHGFEVMDYDELEALRQEMEGA